MRTTIRLDDELLAAAKRRASARNTTLTRVIEDALRAELARRRPDGHERVRLPTFGEVDEKPMPAVDLDDTAALLDLIEEGLPLDKRR